MMKLHTILAFFLIYIFVGSITGLCNQIVYVPPEYNIVKPWDRYSPTSPTYNKKALGDIIRELRKQRRNMRRYIPPSTEYYLDPPRFSEGDKSRMA